jgi:hypothetical protein
MRTVAVMIAVLLCGCVVPATTPSADKLIVEQAVQQCGLVGRVEFAFEGGGKVWMTRLEPNTDFVRFDCLLSSVRARGLKMGFVGREQKIE